MLVLFLVSSADRVGHGRRLLAVLRRDLAGNYPDHAVVDDLLALMKHKVEPNSHVCARGRCWRLTVVGLLPFINCRQFIVDDTSSACPYRLVVVDLLSFLDVAGSLLIDRHRRIVIVSFSLSACCR